MTGDRTKDFPCRVMVRERSMLKYTIYTSAARCINSYIHAHIGILVVS